MIHDTADASGCGVFDYIPVGQPFFIAAWSQDGRLVGTSAWFQLDGTGVAPQIELSAPGGDPSDWIWVYASQAFNHIQ